MSIYGYSRVSTSNQDYKTQIQKPEQAGAEKIFSETYTGTKKEGRKELEELLSIVKTGDQVLVTKIDRLARSIVDLSYLGMNIYINFRVPVLFKIVNNYIRVVVYGILIHYIIQPELRDFFVLLLVAGSISILSRTILFKIISRKINVESSQNKN